MEDLNLRENENETTAEGELTQYYGRFAKETEGRSKEIQLQKAFELALEKNTVPLNEVVIDRENWNALFPGGTVETPVGTVKLGENQFEKLQKSDRSNLLAAMYETLSNPAIVLEKETLDKNSGEFRPVNVYGKSFVREDSNHKRIVESVIIFKDGEEISISTHNKELGRFTRQIKTADQIIFADLKISRVASLILQNGGSHVRLQGINTQALNPNYNINEILSTENLRKQYNKVAVGVAPTIWTPYNGKDSPSTVLTPSTTLSNEQSVHTSNIDETENLSSENDKNNLSETTSNATEQSGMETKNNKFGKNKKWNNLMSGLDNLAKSLEQEENKENGGTEQAMSDPSWNEPIFHDINGNPRNHYEIISILENFSKAESQKWNVKEEDKLAIFHLSQITEIKKGDFKNSLAKLKEYMKSEEFNREEKNYAEIFTPILLTQCGQDFGHSKFSYVFSTDELKPKIPVVKGEIKSVLDNDFSGQNDKRAKEFQDELIKKGVVKAEDKFILVNENEAAARGTKIKQNQPCVILTIPVKTDGKTEFVPTAYYHISALEEPQKIIKEPARTDFQADLPNETSDSDNYPADYKKIKIPEFAVMTQRGLESFKEMVIDRYDARTKTYFLKSEDGKNGVHLTENTLKLLTSEEYAKKAENYTRDTKNAEKMIETQYNDFFNPRGNCANNFRHNFCVFCRKEANSPLDALKIANSLISQMSKEEKRKTKDLLNLLKKDGQTINEVLLETYCEAVKEIPLNEEYLNNKRYDKIIARPMFDTLSAKGEKIDRDFDLKIGDSVDMVFKINKDAKSRSLRKEPLYQNCAIISSSKEGNTVTLMDGNKSFYEVPRDAFLAEYEKQRRKSQKIERKTERLQSMKIEIGR